MDNFKLYADYYNLIYEDKDYKKEAEYCIRHIKKFAPGAKNILNLGCGTGMHDFVFAKNRFSVLGVDISEKMIALAKEHREKLASRLRSKVHFTCSDIRLFRTDRQFDVVTSLFHVMSYQTSAKDVEAALATAYRHLKPGGLFIFDFWYGPAVLFDKPEIRAKKFSGKKLEVTRIAVPQMHHMQNMVDVNYRLFIKEKNKNKITEIEELHRMRYFFMPEFLLWFEKHPFKVLRFCEWLSENEPDISSWSAVFVLQKLR